MSPLLLFGCSVLAAQTTMKKRATQVQSINANSKSRMQTSTKETIEAVSEVSFDGKKFTAKVLSYGCTRSTDFTIEHEVKENSCRVMIRRSKPDMCKRAPMLADIEIEWSPPTDCIGLDLFVTNPVLVTNSQGVITKRAK